MHTIVSTFLLILLLGAGPAAAQAVDGGPVPRIPEAELVFEQGLEAFETGDLGPAAERFLRVAEGFELNRKTTAALLMAGKALYRQGAYERAIAVLTGLVEAYPTSGYLAEARRVMQFASQRMEQQAEEDKTINLGVVLPLRDDDAALTQALFNGIRVAVEEHNAAYPDRPVRMIFRDTRGSRDQAREAVAELAMVEGADAIIGPLYSEEAEAAAATAERAEVVLLAPLATDEAVSEERDYVFQANPTITMRGRQMARFAVQNLGLRTFGVVAELNDSYGERMAEGFQDEALQMGADVLFYKLLPTAHGWARLPEELDPALVDSVDALYLPITGGSAPQLIRAALDGLDEMDADVRVLGNSEWHDLSAELDAARFHTTYSRDFYVEEQDPALQAFQQRYGALLGALPEGQARRLTLTGYDVAHFLLTQMVGAAGRPLHEALREAPPYDGLGVRIDFDGGNVNEALHFLRYYFGATELLR